MFLVGVTLADLSALRDRVRQNPALQITGEALKGDLDAGHLLVPGNVDAVIMSREAVAHTSAAAQSSSDTSTVLFEELTPRERDVLALLSDGYPNRVIAERLGVSEHTVKFHLASIYSKLGASTRTEAVRKGLDLGIIDI